MNSARDRDLAAAGFFAAVVALPLVSQWASGLAHYFGDLGYLHHPWRAYEAQLLQAGRLPLWNPYLYFGMPEAATMQNGLFYPPSALFALFPFPAAAEAFAALHAALAGWLAYLWLRAARLRGAASLLGGAVVCLGGIALRDRVFLNHLSTLAWAPAVFLSFASTGPLALALALGFLAGYPPYLASFVVVAWALALILRPRSPSRVVMAIGTIWLVSAAAAALLCACLLLPAAELFGFSRRSAGVGLGEALRFAFSPLDLLYWFGPLSVWWERFDPSGLWWKTCFVGYAAAASAALGLGRISPRRAHGLVAFIAAAIVLTLGSATPLSRAAWAHFPPLRFVRYPGNLTCLALWPLALLAACGITPGRRWLIALVVAELSWYSWAALPLAPAGIFGSRGPLVSRLQKDLGADRYLLSPRAFGMGTGRDPFDWSRRLYGLMNAPYRLRAAGNVGEPLVPRGNFEVMDALFSAPGVDSVVGFLPWVDVRFLLTPAPVPATRGLEPAGAALWTLSRYTGLVAPASFFNDGKEPPARLALLPFRGRLAAFSRPREDRFSVEGDFAAAGWAYVSEPLYPGWRVALETAGISLPVEPKPAMTAFQKIRVPAGRWRLTFRYDSVSWRRGRFLTLAGLALLAAYWRRRFLRWQTTY